MKYIKYLIIIICLFSYTSCKEKRKSPIDKNTFISILLDIHTLDAYSSSALDGRYIDVEQKIAMEQAILDKYKITKAIFDSCIIHYSLNIKEYSSIYEIVLDSLSSRKTRVETVIAEFNKRDTINIWENSDSIHFHNDTIKTLQYTVPFKKEGLYKLELEIKKGKADKGIGNYITATAIGYKDTILKFDTIKISKDTLWRKYSLTKFVPDTIFKNIRFEIINSRNRDSVLKRDIQIRNIKLFNPIKRERDNLFLHSRGFEDVKF